MKVRLYILACIVLGCTGIQAQTLVDSVSSDYFRNRWHSGNLTNYLEQVNDYTVYHGMTTGQYNVADQLLYSINGHPYSMNRYYYDGYRVDDRFRSGSTVLVPDMEETSLALDVSTATTYFTSDAFGANGSSDRRCYIRVQNTFGGLGGIAPGTKDIIHIFHRTGWEGLYKQEIGKANRPHVTYGLNLAAGFGDHDISFKYYRKQNVNYDQDGIVDACPLVSSDYLSLQAKGKLPVRVPLLNSSLHYMVNLSQRGDMNSEFFYNTAEQARQRNLTTMLYTSGKIEQFDVTTGITFAVNNVKHDDLCFSRNVIDQDGESFMPWVSDGNTYELSVPIRVTEHVTKELYLTGDLYNSYLHFTPSVADFSNLVYYKQQSPLVRDGGVNPNVAEPLYTYQWHSRAFNAGLMENEFLAHYDKQLRDNLSLKSCAGFTVDGFLNDRGTSKVSVNVKASAILDYSPWHWLNVKFSLTHDRKSYTMDDLLFFNGGYMNGIMVSAQTGSVTGSTGGAYHLFGSQDAQTSYTGIEIPIRIYLDKRHRHEIALLQTYRKYHNVWTVNNMQTCSDGTTVYTVGYYPDECMGSSFFTSSPYYFQQTTRYTYTGPKATFSISWQSMQAACLSALGNGPASNNIGVLSETSAYPLTHMVKENINSPNQGVGRADQDKGFICRIYWGYNIKKWMSFGIMGKWTDGQPFTNFYTTLNTASTGEKSVSILPGRSRGTNPIDGDFGSRENAIFNIDAHVRFNWTMWKKHFTANVKCYNIWDFGNSICEYAFNDGLGDGRCDLMLTTPRTLVIDLKVDL